MGRASESHEEQRMRAGQRPQRMWGEECSMCSIREADRSDQGQAYKWISFGHFLLGQHPDQTVFLFSSFLFLFPSNYFLILKIQHLRTKRLSVNYFPTIQYIFLLNLSYQHRITITITLSYHLLFSLVSIHTNSIFISSTSTVFICFLLISFLPCLILHFVLFSLTPIDVNTIFLDPSSALFSSLFLFSISHFFSGRLQTGPLSYSAPRGNDRQQDVDERTDKQ